MAIIDVSKGRYWDEGIQLIDGCTPCSPGCDNCWSAEMTHRYQYGKVARTPYLTDGKGIFNGQIVTHPDRLSRLNTRKPRVFALWNDLFHEGVPEEFQNEVYKAMIINKQNTYLILTKRPQIMARFLSQPSCFQSPILPPIWHGLTVCNQQEADEKIPIFLQVPGKKFLSIEPMLGAIDLTRYLYAGDCAEWCPKGNDCSECNDAFRTMFMRERPISSVILGTETGVNRREMKSEWAESIVDQCDAAGVPSFIKQISINGKVSKDMGDWPEKLRRRNLPWVKK